MKRALALVLLLASAGVSLADQAAARGLYEDGEKAYNLGAFDKAIELFKKAYEAWPEPSFLFNIAQTYRQVGDCKQGLFFYKRFLALKEQDKKKPLTKEIKAEVDARIAELDSCVKTGGTTTSNTASTSATSTSPTTTAATTTADATATSPTTTDTTATTPTTPSDTGESGGKAGAGSLSVRLLAGASKLSVGPLDTGGLQFTGAVVGGYPLAINDKLTLELGADIGFNPVPYTTTTATSGTAKLVAFMANVAPSMQIASKLAVRADIGAGALIVSGLGMDGNPFSETGMGTSGAQTVFHVQAGLSADIAINRQIVLTATPITFGYSPAPSGFLTSISSMTTLAFMVGVGYRK